MGVVGLQYVPSVDRGLAVVVLVELRLREREARLRVDVGAGREQNRVRHHGRQYFDQTARRATRSDRMSLSRHHYSRISFEPRLLPTAASSEGTKCVAASPTTPSALSQSLAQAIERTNTCPSVRPNNVPSAWNTFPDQSLVVGTPATR